MAQAPARIQPITLRRTFWTSSPGRLLRAVVVVSLWVTGVAIIGNGAITLYALVTEPESRIVAAARSAVGNATADLSSFAVFAPTTTPTVARSADTVVVADSAPGLADGQQSPTVASTTASTAVASTVVAPTPLAATRPAPAPPVRLRIDGIGVDAPVVLVRGEDLPRKPIAGWYFGTAYPGDAGNVVLLGHLNGDGEIFADLDLLRPGDSVFVDTAKGTVTYIVEGSQLVDRRAIELLGSTVEPTLTLMTCAGTWRDDIGGYDMRLVVQARLAS